MRVHGIPSMLLLLSVASGCGGGSSGVDAASADLTVAVVPPDASSPAPDLATSPTQLSST